MLYTMITIRSITMDAIDFTLSLFIAITSILILIVFWPDVPVLYFLTIGILGVVAWKMGD